MSDERAGAAQAGPPVRLWKRLAGEFVVIVVGVLVALAVDDWQGGVQRRADAERLVGTMEVDIAESVADLREAIASARIRQSALVELLRRLGEPLPPEGEWIPWEEAPFGDLTGAAAARLRRPDDATLLAAVAVAQVFDPRTAAFDELRSTGTLAAIRDQEVRDRIVRLYAQIMDFAESNQFVRSDQAALMDAWEAAGVVPGDWLSPDETLERLRRDPRALATIRRSYLRAVDQIYSYGTVADFVESEGRSVVAAARAGL